MKRFTYLIPRLIIVALFGLVVWLSIDSILCRTLISNAESITGAKVEIGQLRSNLKEGKIFLREVQVADPRSPDLNLFQADMAYLDIDLTSLLRKKVKITGGRTSDVRFGSPRTVSGHLEIPTKLGQSKPVKAVSARASNPAAPSRNFDNPSDLDARWLDRLQEQIVTHGETELQSGRAIQQIAAKWSPRLSETKSQLNDINERIALLKESLDQETTNPLRRDFESALTEIADLIQKTELLQSNVKNLQSVASADRAKLTSVQHADQQAIAQLAKVQSFESDAISQLLLVRSQRARVDEIIHWFKWFLHAIPDFEQDLNPKSIQGIDVSIPPAKGRFEQPDFLVEDLDIEGAGHFAGQYMNFAGKLTHLSNQPHRHSEPISFDLRAQGKQHFVVKCKLDRRSTLPTDTLEVQCPDLQVVHPPLGSKQSMLVSVGPNMNLQADVRLMVIGEQLSGELVFRHSNVSLHVDQLHALAGGDEMALRLNQQLTSTNTFETRVALSGTLDNYKIDLESDLGEQFAKSMSVVNTEIQRQQLAAQQRKLQTLIDNQANSLTSQINKTLHALSHEAVQNMKWLKRTSTDISSTANAAWPAIR